MYPGTVRTTDDFEGKAEADARDDLRTAERALFELRQAGTATEREIEDARLDVQAAHEQLRRVRAARDELRSLAGDAPPHAEQDAPDPIPGAFRLQINGQDVHLERDELAALERAAHEAEVATAQELVETLARTLSPEDATAAIVSAIRRHRGGGGSSGAPPPPCGCGVRSDPPGPALPGGSFA